MLGEICTIDRTISGLNPTGTTNYTGFTLIPVRIRFTGGPNGILWYAVGKHKLSLFTLSQWAAQLSQGYCIIVAGYLSI